ncbi:MAG: GNAT family N-acetyltransferase [Streptomycetales bacterium]
MTHLEITPAEPCDLDVILALRDEAARWLRERGSDQWQRPWPSEDLQAERIRSSIANGETWMVRDGDRTAATLAIDHEANPTLWTEAERAESALFVHRLIVSRAYAGKGLGAQLLNWATEKARQGARWLRVDVWTTNYDLQRYYLAQGFGHVRTLHLEDYPSGALLQRRVGPDKETAPRRGPSG